MELRLLVPVDRAALSEQAIPWADALARALPARVDLLRVVPRMDMLESSSDDVYDYYLEQDVADATRAVDQLRSRFTQATQIDTEVVVGSPADVIIDRARASAVDFIVMATHSRAGLPRALLGSVTGRVVRRSGTPVMAIRPDIPASAQTPRRILVPLDGSDLSAAVVPHACTLADRLGATLVLYTVAAHGPIAAIMGKLESVSEAISSQGIGVEVHHGEGDPGPSIVAFAAQSQCGLIAMSTHGRAGIGRWTMGSVTDWAIHYAQVPVMAVRPLQLPASTTVTLRPDEVRTTDNQPVTVTFTAEQARLARVAIENLAWSATRHDHLAAGIRGALLALDAAREAPSEREPVSPRG